MKRYDNSSKVSCGVIKNVLMFKNFKTGFISLMIFIFTAGCGNDTAEDRNSIVYLDQGWNSNEYREISYNTSQGSRLMPYKIFMGLELNSSTEKLNSPSSMEELRYISNKEATQRNPDNLPVGFVKDIDADNKEWIGVTCAACHTAQINYQDVSIRIDGGPTMGDFAGLLDKIQISLTATLTNPEKFKRLAQYIYQDSWEEKLVSLQAELTFYAYQFKNTGTGSTKNGHGRIDAFGSIGNKIFVADLQNPNNFKVSDAPVSYPVLWDTPNLQNIQWTGNMENPLLRNAGEVVGTFGVLDLMNQETFLHNSVKITNIYNLEEMLRVLKSPMWPEQYLGTLDKTKIEEGRKLYLAEDGSGYSCVSCHSLKDSNGQYPLTPAEENLYGKQFIKTVLTPVEEIGTDTKAADTLHQPFSVDLGPLLAPIVGTQYQNRIDAVVSVVDLVINKAFKDLNLSTEQQAAYVGYRTYAEGYSVPTAIYAYKARPLNGVWASSPYLHNGSVRTLKELLIRDTEREKSFFTGSRSFDPIDVGFKSIDDLSSQRFDVNLSGNNNSGHNYGVNYTDTQKKALIEFLKSL